MIGVPDETWGEVGRAFVVVRDGQPSSTRPTLLAHLDGRLARYKLPKSVVFVPELPAQRVRQAAEVPTARGYAREPLRSPRIDLDAITALDVHVHVESDGHGHLSLDEELMDASAAYFKGSENRTPTVADLAARYRDAGMAAVVFTVDATTATGHPALSSEEIAEAAAEHADVLIPFGSVDPHQGQPRVERARRLVEEYGVRGFKFHPSLQAFSPGRPARSPAVGDARGARRARAVPHRPERHRRRPAGRARDQAALLQPAAARRRRRRLPRPDRDPGPPVGARGRPRRSRWPRTRRTSSSTCPAGGRSTSRPSWSAPPAGMLRHKVLFGSDYPLITPERWLEDFAGARHRRRTGAGDPQGQRDRGTEAGLTGQVSLVDRPLPTVSRS